MTDPLQAALAKKKGASRAREQIHKTRAQEAVHPPVHGADSEQPWLPGSNLEAPPPRPGMAQRWVRVGVQGQDDPTNVAQRLREGWVARKADTLPDGFAAPKIQHGQFAGVIGIHGMILCEIPLERMKARAEWVAKQSRLQTQAVEQGLARASDPRVPLIHQRKTEVVKRRDPTIPQAAPSDESDADN